MLNQIVNDQATTLRDNVYFKLIVEGVEEGTAFDVSEEVDFTDLWAVS
jgi:hypothetical protein